MLNSPTQVLQKWFIENQLKVFQKRLRTKLRNMIHQEFAALLNHFFHLIKIFKKGNKVGGMA